MKPLPEKTRVIIIGAGFARRDRMGARADQLGTWDHRGTRADPGVHASGRNAALVRAVETDPVMLTLALRSVAQIRQLADGHGELIRSTGNLTLAGRGNLQRLEAVHDALRHAAVASELMPLRDARQRVPFLERMHLPPTDPTTAILLAEKLSRCAPGLADLTLDDPGPAFAPSRRSPARHRS